MFDNDNKSAGIRKMAVTNLQMSAENILIHFINTFGNDDTTMSPFSAIGLASILGKIHEEVLQETFAE